MMSAIGSLNAVIARPSPPIVGARSRRNPPIQVAAGRLSNLRKAARVVWVVGRGGLEPPASAVIGPERCRFQSGRSTVRRGVMWPGRNAAPSCRADQSQSRPAPCRGIRREVLVQLLLCVLLSDMIANPLPPTCRVTRSSFSRSVLARSGEKVRDGNTDHFRNGHADLRGPGLTPRYAIVAQLHR